jgi:hypothetical protein
VWVEGGALVIEKRAGVATDVSSISETIGSRLTDRLRSLGPKTQALAAFLGYCVVSTAIWGPGVLGHLSTSYWGVISGDMRYYSWFFAWWPRALLSGWNPLLTHVLWTPHATNMAWVTSIPGPSLLMTPVTILLGPVVAVNLLALAAPPLSAWGCYLLCRRITSRFWPAAAGGYLFGFSTYEIAQMQGHLNLVLVFCAPLCVYLVLRHLDGSMGRRRFVLLLAATLALQLSISTEVFATMSVFGAIAMGGAFPFGPRERRGELLRTGGLIGLSYLGAGLFMSPLLFYATKSFPVPPRDVVRQSVDALGFVVPRTYELVGGHAFRRSSQPFTASLVEDGAYLGVPLLLVLVCYGLTRRRERLTWFLLGLTALFAVAAMGPVLHIAGRMSITLPWRIAIGLPLLKFAQPDRFTVYVALAVGVIASIWLASAGPLRQWKWGLVGVAAITLLPNVAQRTYAANHEPVYQPAFFTQGEYRNYLTPGENVVIIAPTHDDSLLWQADASMSLNNVLGATQERQLAGSFDELVAFDLLDDQPQSVDPGTLSIFLQLHDVGAVIIAPAVAANWAPLMQDLRLIPQQVGGVILYVRHA